MADFPEFGIEGSPGRQIDLDRSALQNQGASTMSHLAYAGSQLQNMQKQQMLMQMAQEQLKNPGGMGGMQQVGGTQQGQPDPYSAMADSLLNMSKMEFAVGNIEGASQSVNRASESLARGARAAQESATVKINQAKEAREQIEEEISYLSQVTDDASLMKAKSLWIQAHPGQELPPLIQGINKYNPKVIDFIRGMALKEKDRLHAEMEKARTESYVKLSNAHVSHLKWQEDADTQVDLAARKWNARVGKTGGIAPTAEETKAAADIIAMHYPSLISADPDAAARTYGREMVDIANGIRAANPAISRSEAMNKAFLDMQTRNRFGKAKQFGGDTVATALPLPKVIDPSLLIVGKIYNDVTGPGRWNGKKFIPVEE